MDKKIKRKEMISRLSIILFLLILVGCSGVGPSQKTPMKDGLYLKYESTSYEFPNCKSIHYISYRKIGADKFQSSAKCVSYVNDRKTNSVTYPTNTVNKFFEYASLPGKPHIGLYRGCLWFSLTKFEKGIVGGNKVIGEDVWGKWDVYVVEHNSKWVYYEKMTGINVGWKMKNNNIKGILIETNEDKL